jgi:hypothetical protein
MPAVVFKADRNQYYQYADAESYRTEYKRCTKKKKKKKGDGFRPVGIL